MKHTISIDLDIECRSFEHEMVLKALAGVSGEHSYIDRNDGGVPTHMVEFIVSGVRVVGRTEIMGEIYV